MKFLKNESGNVLAIVALCLPVLFGFMGLAVDVGLLFRAKRNLQIAADAAAVAGALDYLYNASATSATTAATASAAANGIVAATGGPTITVNAPPASGPNAGVAGFVEVIITDPSPTFFLGMISHSSSVGVATRAVAGSPGPSADCVYVLDPTASDAMDLQGSFDVSANHCGVVVDSNASDALQFTGAGGTLTAGSISVVGGDGGQTGDSTPTPITGSAPVSDPLRITGPTPTNGQCTTTNTTTTTLTGTIAGPGAGSSVCYTQAINLSNVTLGNGIYVFENGVTTSGNITTTVSSNYGGATLDVEGGSFNVNTGTVLALTAPTTGTTNGIALMEPATNSNTITIQKGDASGSLTGIIYAPSAQLYLQDSGGDSSGGLTITADLIVDELFDKTATLTINSYSSSYASSPLRAVTLVE
jgi:hypothetical protein